MWKELEIRWANVQKGKWETLFFYGPGRGAFQKILDGLTKMVGYDTAFSLFDLSAFQHDLPFFPFINLLREQGIPDSLRDWKHICQVADVFPYHRDLFFNLLRKKTVLRHEDVFLFDAEVDFESKTIQDSLSKLINHFAQERTWVIFLDNIDLGSNSLLDFLDFVSELELTGKVMILGYHQTKALELDAASSRRFMRFVADADQSGRYWELSYDGGTILAGLPRRQHKVDWKILMQKGIVALNLFSLKEAHQDLFRAKELAEGEGPSNVPAELYENLGKTSLYLGEYNEALLYFQTALNLVQTAGRTRPIIQVGMYLAFVFFKRKESLQADKTIRQILALARELDEPRLLAKVMFLEKYINENKEPEEKNYREFLELIQVLNRLHYRNFLSIIFSLTSFLRLVATFENWDKAAEYCRLARREARRTHHMYRQSVIYHAMGYLQELRGKKTDALKEFNRSIKLRQLLGNQVELIKVYNGTGYFCFLMGNFILALNYFEKSLRHLENEKDYVETSLTLFNIGIVYFSARDYKKALGFMESILSIMDELQIPELPWHSRRDIFSMAGFCCLKMGSSVRAWDYYYKATRVDMNPDSSAAFLLLDLVMERPGNPKDDAHRVSLAKEVAKSENHPFFLQILESELMGKAFLTPPEKLKQIRFSTGFIRELARMESDLNQLHRKIHEMNFLNSLQTVIIQAGSNNLIVDFMTLLKSNFLSNLNLWIHEQGNRKRSIVYPIQVDSISMPTHLMDFLEPLYSLREGLFLPIGDLRLPEGISSLVFIPLVGKNEPQDWILFATMGDCRPLILEDYRILALSVKQLSLAVALRRANDLLTEAVTIDALTGLYNRQELMNKLDLERKRLGRYFKKKSEQFTLIFMDLDHFRFYNETFGTPVGDLILRLFSKVLKRCSRDIDILGRHGGDEFLMILPETQPLGAFVVARRILDYLVELDHFQREIEEFLGHKIHIPMEKKLTCTLGIAGFSPDKDEENLELMMQKGDQALDLAKKSGKNKVVMI